LTTRSKKSTENTTRIPATNPMTIAHGPVIAAVPAVMPTNPARSPFPVIETSGLPVFSHTVIMAPSAPAHAASVVVTAMPPIAASAASSDPGLNPYQPTSRMKQPRIANGTLCPRIARGLPSGPYFPRRGPRARAPQNDATPPTMCTMLDPAKSWYPVGKMPAPWNSHPPPHCQRTTTG
jgi:hypothetical protein